MQADADPAVNLADSLLTVLRSVCLHGDIVVINRRPQIAVLSCDWSDLVPRLLVHASHISVNWKVSSAIHGIMISKLG